MHYYLCKFFWKLLIIWDSYDRLWFGLFCPSCPYLYKKDWILTAPELQNYHTLYSTVVQQCIQYIQVASAVCSTCTFWYCRTWDGPGHGPECHRYKTKYKIVEHWITWLGISWYSDVVFRAGQGGASVCLWNQALQPGDDYKQTSNQISLIF